MITKKVILTVSLLSLIYTGCTEDEKVQEKTTVTEVKTEPSTKAKVESKPTVVTVNEPSKIEKPATPVIPVAKVVVVIPTGKSLYKKCQACHGANAEKKALNKSEIIQLWDASKIENALTGYKTGSYGGPMKGLMKSQVANLSQSDIKILSTYIASLKK